MIQDSDLQRLCEATEQLRQRFNEVIAEKQLSPQDALIVLANLSAGYSHMVKRVMKTPEQKDAVEDVFTRNYQIFLGLLEGKDISAEIDKMEREKAN